MVTRCGVVRVGQEIERLAVARVDLDDRFLFDDEVGEDDRRAATRLCSMAWKVSSVAPTRVEMRGAADGAFVERERLGGAAREDEGIETERRLLRRELVLGVLAGERDERARDGNFVHAVLGERDADGVADAVGQQRADADGALDAAVLAVARLGHAEVQRVIPVGPELEQPRGEHADRR